MFYYSRVGGFEDTYSPIGYSLPTRIHQEIDDMEEEEIFYDRLKEEEEVDDSMDLVPLLQGEDNAED